MTSEAPNLHVSKNLDISRTERDIKKLKTPFWKCFSVAFKTGSAVFRCRSTLRKAEPISRIFTHSKKNDCPVLRKTEPILKVFLHKS